MATKQIKAGPTKAFFVTMVTRDIDLSDAILDLLDNCVDGIARQEHARGAHQNGHAKPYKNYWAKIVASESKFEIWDNCGGIPEDVAEKYAFMLGRPDPNRDTDIETVGMYGIGMKRAIFKMGENCVVTSQPSTGQFKVEISKEWMNDDDNWELPLTSSAKRFEEDGTKITVTELRDGVARQFNKKKSPFLADLEKEISRHYALILQKGFKVFLNGDEVAPISLAILAPKKIGVARGPKIEPYVFVGEFDQVEVGVVVGFYRPLVKEQELDETLLKSTRDHAGWTVICNDRVVLYNDKSPKTGWGTRSVPSFHNQFISIAGIVLFRSKNSVNLPLNTTKRGIDTSSDVYHIVLEFMQDGLKKFTSFTNVWKRQEELTEADFESLESQNPIEFLRKLDRTKLTSIRRHRDKGAGSFYAPTLPKPTTGERKPRICFQADPSEIEIVADYYFDDSKRDRNEVGRRCFDESLERARESQS